MLHNHKIHSSLLLAAFTILALSCAPRAGKYQSEAATETADTSTLAVKTDSISVAPATGESHRLCEQTLTSFEGIMASVPDSCECFEYEMTPTGKAFFVREPGLRDCPTVRTATRRYNYISLFNRVLHGYEWFCRVSSAEDCEGSGLTLQDTLRWVKTAQPEVDAEFIRKMLPEKYDAGKAAELLRAFRDFNGRSEEGTDFYAAEVKYIDGFQTLPTLVTEEQLDSFKAGFWEWYDKACFVPEIGSLIAVNFAGSGTKLTERQLDSLKAQIECETDIDRRTILALEYVKSRGYDGTVLLGEILESGLYTRYLLEAWISWRAHVQADHLAISSFAVIPNNYFDMMRVKCMNTILRHWQDSPNTEDLCLLENLILCEILHRSGSMFGNQSMIFLYALNNEMFIDPKLLKEES